MTERSNADNFEGERTVPLPLQGHLEHGWFQTEYAGLWGDWEVIMKTDGGEWPNALIDQEEEKYIIFTYPRGRHQVSEVNIGRDPDIGVFMIVDITKKAALNWFEPEKYDERTPDEFDPAEDFDENSQTPILISKNPDSQYGRAVIFWRPSTQYLDKVVDLTPFEWGSPRLTEAADKVIEALGLPRGKPKPQHNRTDDIHGIDRKRAGELHDKFEDFFRGDESE